MGDSIVMLSRSAQGLYWMGRYLERAEHLGRLMQLQVSSLVDRPAFEIHFGWDRIYKHLHEEPPGGALEDWSDAEEYTLADSFTLADDLTFERSNHYSVWRCFQLGRENARQNRHCVRSEMWTCLNLAYLKIRDRSIVDVWAISPEKFYVETIRDINTFLGVASATMYRDEGWHFMQLGRMLEHIQLLCALLSTQLTMQLNVQHSAKSDTARDFEWSSLLHCYQADEPYQQKYGLKIDQENVLDMLVTDVQLPGSLNYAIDQVNSRLDRLGDAPSQKEGAMASRMGGRLMSLINFEWPDTEDRSRMLELCENLAFRLHDQLSLAWFDYEVNDAEQY